MSEHQFVYFAAVDRPLDDKQLAYMRRQSTRADVSRWEFTNEYHFGDFHGSAREMLRRGYDVHLHYADFGVRRLMFRLPGGLAWRKKTFDAFGVDYGIFWKADKKGRGGTIEIDPQADAGTYDDCFDELNDFARELGRIRELLIGGDLRPLYLAWLASINDQEALEPPVPGGLSKLPPELVALAQFYELSEDLIQAAAERSPHAPKPQDGRKQLQAWIERQSLDDLRDLAGRMLADDTAGVRAETLARMRDETAAMRWPTTEPSRTLGELHEAAERQQGKRKKREASQRKRARQARIVAIAADPDNTITHVKQLVKLRSTTEYERAAEELVVLREALGPKRAEAVAKTLVRENPTLNHLKSSLRRRGLLPTP